MQYKLSRVVIGPFLRAIGRPKVVGIENIPSTGPAILASNHLSFIDSMYLPLMIDRPVVFPAKAEYFTARGPLGRLWAAYLRSTNQLETTGTGRDPRRPRWRRRWNCCERGSFSGSIRRAPGRRTAGSTGAGPVSAGWR
jgi:hypothetical protein